MLSRPTCTVPVTGVLKIDVFTSCPRHSTSRGNPALTEMTCIDAMNGDYYRIAAIGVFCSAYSVKKGGRDGSTGHALGPDPRLRGFRFHRQQHSLDGAAVLASQRLRQAA